MKKYRGFLIAGLIGLTGIVYGSPRIQDIGSFGGYGTGIIGRTNGSFVLPGDDQETTMLPGLYKHNSSFSTGGYFGGNAFISTSEINGSGGSGLGHGFFNLNGNLATKQIIGRSLASGGWVETFTIDSPGLTGNSGKLVYTIDLSVLLYASGIGSSRFYLGAYKDDDLIPRDDIFDAANGDLASNDRQLLSHTVESGTESIVRTVTFSLPFTYGQSFELGVFASGITNSRSGGPNSLIGVGQYSVNGGWNGFASVLDGSGSPVSDYSIVSASGQNWAQPVPEPASLALLGLGGVYLLRRRR